MTRARLGYAVAAALLLAAPAARAAEGGGSVYLQGTYNDWTAGMVGPAGFYMRDDVTWYQAGIGVRPLGGKVDVGGRETIWVNTLKLSWASDIRILGGRFGVAVAAPMVLNVNVEANLAVAGTNVFRNTTSAGFADPYVIPGQINWSWGNNNLTAGLGIVLPIGRYSVDRRVNLGRNYRAFDPFMAYTYLHPKQGFEVSGTAGLLLNTENGATSTAPVRNSTSTGWSGSIFPNASRSG